MDRSTARQISAVIEKHLPAINADLEALNIVGKMGNASYTDIGCTTKLVFADVVGGVVQSAAAAAFKAAAQFHGIDPELLNKPFTSNGSTYVLTGYKPRASRYPYVFTKDGRSMKGAEDYVKMLIKEAADA